MGKATDRLDKQFNEVIEKILEELNGDMKEPRDTKETVIDVNVSWFLENLTFKEISLYLGHLENNEDIRSLKASDKINKLKRNFWEAKWAVTDILSDVVNQRL